jgi:hypothetical protein
VRLFLAPVAFLFSFFYQKVLQRVLNNIGSWENIAKHRASLGALKLSVPQNICI